MADLTSSDAPGTLDGALCSTVLDLVRTLLDIKTFACGNPYNQFSALKGVLRPVEACAKKVHKTWHTRC